MLEVLLESLPLALGVAFSPVPIAATLVLMMTPGAKANAPALLLGWIVGIVTVAVVVILLPGFETARGGPTVVSGYVRLALGIVLILLAARAWKRRPRPGDEVEPPALLARLDGLDGPRSALTGFLLAAVNPKNALLVAGAANIIDTEMLSPSQQVTALALFTLAASSTIVAPVVGRLLFADAADRMFARWKGWLIRNTTVVMAVLLLLFGALLAVTGARIVLG